MMAITKTATIVVRVEPRLKKALKKAAQKEYRSISNLLEVIIRERCEQNGIAIEKNNVLDQQREQ